MVKPIVHAKTIQRSVTNGNQRCKSYILVVGAEGQDTSLIIKKIVLTNTNFDAHEYYGFKLIKEFKNHRLYKQTFSLKLSSLDEINNWMDRLIG